MKLKLITFFAVLVFALAGIPSLAHAHDYKTEKTKIPFDFYAGAQKMSAGSYSIGIDLETDIITFTDESGKQRIFLMGTPDGEGEETAQLVFEHLGDVYALQELKSDVIDLAFQTRMPVPVMKSGNASSQVEVALTR
jgi:hypothetical protein